MKKVLLLIIIVTIFSVACGEAKPSRGQVEAGFKEQIQNTTPLESDVAQEAIDNYTKCFIDEVYDDLSVETLQALQEGSDREPSNDEANVISAALTKCSGELISATEQAD